MSWASKDAQTVKKRREGKGAFQARGKDGSSGEYA